MYADSQVKQHQQMLLSGVFGNPHSSNPTSLAATKLVESARESVLRFFNADPDEYDVIFTQNASGALKVVGEAYPFEPGDQYLLTFDNHNSVNGIREFAHARGAEVTYVPVSLPDMRVDESMLEAAWERARPGGNNLFAYPAQSNFSSVQHPLEWIERARLKGWDVLLDAAAFAPSNRLDLSRFKPDFIPLSFYKIFGYPTGIGALIAHRDNLHKLHRPWFAGGTITEARLNHALVKNYSIVGLYWGLYRRQDPRLVRRAHDDLSRLVDAGGVRPLVSERLPFPEAAQGLGRLAKGETIGRLTVLPPA